MAAKPSGSAFGSKVRMLRRREKLSQVQLADRLGISPSYLNLIEHNQRPLTAPLLLKLAQLFSLDVAAFAEEGEARLAEGLQEVFGDALFEAGITLYLSDRVYPDLNAPATDAPATDAVFRALLGSDGFFDREPAHDPGTPPPFVPTPASHDAGSPPPFFGVAPAGPPPPASLDHAIRLTPLTQAERDELGIDESINRP